MHMLVDMWLDAIPGERVLVLMVLVVSVRMSMFK
jgi:hypothetical protein